MKSRLKQFGYVLREVVAISLWAFVFIKLFIYDIEFLLSVGSSPFKECIHISSF